MPLLGLIAVSVLLTACSPSIGSFERALTALDANEGRGSGTAALARAAHAARSSSDWLSVLKRAHRLDTSSAIALVEKATKAMPSSEPLARAAAYLFLRSGEPGRALALFREPGTAVSDEGAVAPLSPQEHPELWAEACLRSRLGTERTSLSERPEVSAELARILGEPRYYIEAAAQSLAQGDRFAASGFLKAAIAGGAAPPDGLLWDAGLSAELAARAADAQAPASAARSFLLGDAALLAGDLAAAAQAWRRGLELDPRASWKARAKLALAAPDATSAQAELQRLIADFPREPAARRFAVAFLLGSGQADTARRLLEETDSEQIEGVDGLLLGLLALQIEGAEGVEGRYKTAVLRFAEAHPDSGEAHGAALRLLLERGAFADYLVLADAGAARGLAPSYSWYYAAAAEALRGDFTGAAEGLEREGAARPGSAAPYFLGLLYAELGDYPRALERLEIARDAARGKEVAKILKEIGRSQIRLGEKDLARAAFRAAAMADPEDPEAAFLSSTQ